jgi:8-oxo-dGTP pyrophosphatase MutT (NUDIX family)
VIVDRHVMICTNADGKHPWPGGRRALGESFAETARREVHEETGWMLNAESIRDLGWLHFEHLSQQPDDYPNPHPDFLQIVCTGSASVRDHRHDAWTDTEGYEVASELVPIEDVPAHLSGDPVAQLSRPFLSLF